MMIFGASEVSRNVDLGDETTTMMCNFVIRASDASSIIKEIESDLQGWLDDITDGGVEYLPEDEVKEVAAERLKISMERIALLKSAQPPPQTPKSEVDDDSDKDDDEKKEVDKDGKPKGPSTLSSLTAEHQALQAAVLQE